MNDSDGCVEKDAPAAVPTAFVSDTSATGPPTSVTLPDVSADTPFNDAVKVSVYDPTAPRMPSVENTASPPVIVSAD